MKLTINHIKQTLYIGALGEEFAKFVLDTANKAIEIALAEANAAQAVNIDVPHITIEQVKILYPSAEVIMLKLLNEAIDKHNASIDAYNEKQANEQYITAEGARALGAGKAEWFDDAFKQWKLCTPDICNYHPYFKYRAIKQPEPLDLSNIKGVGRNFEIKPEPVEPTCQIKNLDSGLTETMTREKAKLLQAELGDAVEWTNPFGQKPVNLMFKDLSFDCEGIYTYKRKAKPLKQVSLDPVIREGVISLLNELGVTK